MSDEIKKENTKSDAALREEKILEFWRENKTFEKSLEKKSSKGHYVFYDGPPFATGQIHYGHILGSTVKDVIGRYKTMQGYYVPRKWGWDCHGLPIENIVEKELGVAGHKEIEKLGIDKFVEHARSLVLQYDKDWERGIERIGRWVDFQGQYKTMDNTFIESVWWALSELNKKNLIYEGVRVLAYCARCETPISNSEIAMDNSYKDIADISVYAKFELEDPEGKGTSYGAGDPKTYMLAWTTTPWTLPGNTAIAINKNIIYVKVKVGNDILILAKETLQNVLKDKAYSVLGEIKSGELLGKKYKPVFPYYKNSIVAKNENIWKIWNADFVTTEKGTGIAHEAPAFGEDDMNLAKANNIPWILHVDETGRFKSEVTDFAGMKVKPKDTAEDKDAHLRADIEIIKYLQKNGAYFDKEKIIHSYPHCMRCDTPIIYYALSSWFVNIAKEKENIIKQSHKINWIPEYLKEGRFKNIVESAPDWNISRNRYWATPLPIWKCGKCKKQVFVNSLADLKEKTKKSANKYLVMRHGEAENNVLNIYSSDPTKHRLTEKGQKEVLEAVENLKNKKITKIYSSPYLRAKETAEIAAAKLGFSKDAIIYDERIRELEFGEFSGRPTAEYGNHVMKNEIFGFDTRSPGGESFQDGKNRIGNFLYNIDTQNKNETILIISHGLLVEVMPGIIEGSDKERTLEIFNSRLNNHTAEVHMEQEFIPLPHNANYELDLHRPYIDEISLVCDCGGNLTRIPEVLDSWFESGSMPFAQDHFPFENKDWKKNNFPAGFVAEYIGQVRTWFYYTHVVSSILFDHTPFHNIISTGTVRAEDGEKMSKSKHNYPDPWVFIDKYGVDALRLYLMSSTLMKGEDANFSEKTVQDISSKIIGRLMNVLAFYELYPEPEQTRYGVPKSKNVLDVWILTRFNQTLAEITKGMELYDMAEATRPIDSLVDDLSTWYLRRSRDRIKDANKEDSKDARQTLYYVSKMLAKVLAPFAPFVAEDIWLKLKNEDDEESVHLAEWPEVEEININIITNMNVARQVVSIGLEVRQKEKIQIRQPLAELVIDYSESSLDYPTFLSNELRDIITQELNIKKITFKKISGPIPSVVAKLDTNITPALKAEGEYRDFMRELQDKRKQMGLNPGDKMSMSIEHIYKKYKIMPNLQMHMLRVAAVASMICDNFGEPMPTEEIITACLLHDMGNILKSKFEFLPEFLEPEGLEYWQNVKNEYREKYGVNEHHATLKIMKELQASENLVNLVDQVRFSQFCKHRDGDDFIIKIIVYADTRVDPHGVVSYEERLEESKKRYKDIISKRPKGEREKLAACGRDIEKQIFAKCKIKPEDITNESVAPIIAELKNFVIK